MDESELTRRAKLYPDLLQSVVSAKQELERCRTLLSIAIPSGTPEMARYHTLAHVDDQITMLEATVEKCAQSRKTAGGDSRRKE